jgi:peptide/nickel transport system ATP-binding protein
MSSAEFATERPAVTAPNGSAVMLDVSGLRIDFATASGYLNVVDDVSFQVRGSETLALVGESGSGKTVSALSIMGLLPVRSCRVAASRMQFWGRDLLSMEKEEIRNLRGNEISMIFQEPMTSLNPSFTVGNQIIEAIRVHRRVSKAKARERALEVLDLVGIADPLRRMDDYPHALSGGMRQRAMIAMALACEPRLLIADEPTTALDVTIQAQVLELLRRLQNELGMAILFVTHDLGVVAEIADRITVLYAGQTVEVEPVEDLFKRPHHPYSEALMASMPQVAAVGQPLTVIPGHVPRPGEFPDGCRFHPRCRHAADECKTGSPEMGPRTRCVRDGEITLNGSMWTAVRLTPTPERTPLPEPAALLDVRDLAVSFPVHSGVLRRTIGHVKAVDGVSFSIGKGQTMGLVGESGSGKSTTARLVLRLIEPNAGTIRLGELDVTSLGKTDLRRARARMQIVFQDPYSSLDPRSTIAETIGEPLEVHLGLHGRARDDRVRQLLKEVGLDPRVLTRYPHEFSGGQRQRIAVARALALEPELLICDEPVSSLDVSTQSQVINLLDELQDRLGLTCLFIAHDLSVVRHISDRIAVMYLGRIVEIGPAERVYTGPRHPYTEALLSAIPVPDPVEQHRRSRIVLKGDIPSPINPPSGCRFHTRCPYVMEICSQVDPPAFTTDDGTTVWCHLHTTGPVLAGAPVNLSLHKKGAGTIQHGPLQDGPVQGGFVSR